MTMVGRPTKSVQARQAEKKRRWKTVSVAESLKHQRSNAFNTLRPALQCAVHDSSIWKSAIANSNINVHALGFELAPILLISGNRLRCRQHVLHVNMTKC